MGITRHIRKIMLLQIIALRSPSMRRIRAGQLAKVAFGASKRNLLHLHINLSDGSEVFDHSFTN
jgi:hypothetical protein